jgi:hypothetical protein
MSATTEVAISDTTVRRRLQTGIRSLDQFDFVAAAAEVDPAKPVQTTRHCVDAFVVVPLLLVWRSTAEPELS